MWHLPLRVICRTLCRAGPACPAGINAYCAAGHMGPALRIILRPLRCRASPTGGRRGGRPCPPAGGGVLDVPAGRCGHRPLRAICRTPLQGGARVPRRDQCISRGRTHGSRPTNHTAPLRCRVSPTGGRRGGQPCPPAGDGALDVPAERCGISPTGDLPHPSVGRGPRAPPRASRIARRDTRVPPYESYCALFGTEHHRQADVGADDPVRPNSAKRCHSEPVTVSLARNPFPSSLTS